MRRKSARLEIWYKHGYTKPKICLQVVAGSAAVTSMMDIVSARGLDLGKVALQFKTYCVNDLCVISDVPIFNWPSEWRRTRVLRIHAPNCPTSVFNSHRVMLDLMTPKTPALFHKCPKLTKVVLYVSDDASVLKNLTKLPSLDLVILRFDAMPSQWPTSMCRYRGWMTCKERLIVWKALWPYSLLQASVYQGLVSHGAFNRWLTRGLYDPRLLQTIASFVMPLAK